MLTKTANLSTFPTSYHRLLLGFYARVKVNCMNILFIPVGEVGCIPEIGVQTKSVYM